MIKDYVRDVCPPVLWRGLSQVRQSMGGSRAGSGDRQDLDVYWNPEMAEQLDNWGEGTAWDEIRLLIANCTGPVLDIACGTGKTIDLLAGFHRVEIHGCDISDLLIQKALERGIPAGRVKVLDATKLDYPDDAFNHAYTIGSLEHFTVDGLRQCIGECRRVAKVNSFHQIPVSRSGRDEGWKQLAQSFWCNSVEWWVEQFRQSYSEVQVVDSHWSSDLLLSKWFICW